MHPLPHCLPILFISRQCMVLWFPAEINNLQSRFKRVVVCDYAYVISIITYACLPLYDFYTRKFPFWHVRLAKPQINRDVPRSPSSTYIRHFNTPCICKRTTKALLHKCFPEHSLLTHAKGIVPHNSSFFFEQKKYWYFSYLSIETYVVVLIRSASLRRF